MRRHGFIAAAYGGALALALGGCQTVGPASVPVLAAGGLVYEGGTATQAFAASASQVDTAVLEAMSDLSIHQVKQTNNVSQISFDGKTVDGRRAAVTVDTRVNPLVVTARFGWLGDEALSRAFMDRVAIRLGTLPPAAIPAEPPSTPARPPISMGPERTIPSSKPLSDSGYRDTPVP
jgi:hypothetical protein